jgi:hypothetical protein
VTTAPRGFALPRWPAYLERVRFRWSTHRDQAHLVTEARQPRSAEISQRERRYLLIMGIRLICFVVTVVMFVIHAGWLTVIPATGAILLPYFAVVVANTRRSGGAEEFRAYQPRLPERYSPADPRRPDQQGGQQPGNGGK